MRTFRIANWMPCKWNHHQIISQKAHLSHHRNRDCDAPSPFESLHSPAVNRLELLLPEPIDQPSWTLSYQFPILGGRGLCQFGGGRVSSKAPMSSLRRISKKQKYLTSNSIAQIFQSITKSRKVLRKPRGILLSANTDGSELWSWDLCAHLQLLCLPLSQKNNGLTLLLNHLNFLW